MLSAGVIDFPPPPYRGFLRARGVSREAASDPLVDGRAACCQGLTDLPMRRARLLNADLRAAFNFAENQ
jgi:hypothetical protein